MKPRVLIGYSACPLTLDAFERAGCEAWTCDLLPSRGRPDRHIEGNIWDVARDRWDAGLFHPMCTFLTISAAWAFADPDFERYPGIGYHQQVGAGTFVGGPRRTLRDEAIYNFKQLDTLPYPHAIENPAPSFVSKAHRPPDQTIQPHQFGDDASKRTGLWLRGLPRLRPTGYVHGRIVRNTTFGEHNAFTVERWANQTDSGQNRPPPSEDRWLERSAAYPGIAAAMGAQWGEYLAMKKAA